MSDDIGLTPCLPKFCNEGDTDDVKIDTITDVAKSIWKKIIEYNLKNKITPDTENILLDHLQIEYRDFFMSFPLVLRWMVQMRQFKVKTFKEYLKIFLVAKIGSRLDFLKLQGKYLVMLYREFNPTKSTEEIKYYEEELFDNLASEDDTFKEIEEEAKAEILKDNARMGVERRQELYNALLRKKAEAAEIAENTEKK